MRIVRLIILSGKEIVFVIRSLASSGKIKEVLGEEEESEEEELENFKKG